MQRGAIGSGPHVAGTVEAHIVRAGKEGEALGRRSEQLAEFEAFRVQAAGLDLGLGLLEQLVDLARERLAVDVDGDDGLVPLVVGELFPASLQGVRRIDHHLQRRLQLVLGLGEEQRPVSELVFGDVGAPLGRRRLLSRDVVGDEAREELHHRDGALVDLAWQRGPRRTAHRTTGGPP